MKDTLFLKENNRILLVKFIFPWHTQTQVLPANFYLLQIY